jgi:hypothetical protein
MERFMPRGLLLLLIVVALMASAQTGEGTANRFCAYQSNHTGRWHIYALRSIGSVIDTIRVSPNTEDPPYGFTEPTMLGDGPTIYCCMLAHKRSIGDSAYVMVRASDNWGDSWYTLTTIGENSAIARRLRATYENSIIYVIWEDCRSGVWEVYYEEID